jgi:hypothetical protein
MTKRAMEASPVKDGWGARIAAAKGADEKDALMRSVETIVP